MTCHLLLSLCLYLLLLPLVCPTSPSTATADSSSGPASNTNKLAAVILLTQVHYKGADRAAKLKTVVRLFQAHLFPKTPTEVYVFTHAQLVSKLEAAVEGLGSNIHIVALKNLHWEPHEAAQNSSLWHGHWNSQYRLMGDWRMVHMPALIRTLGHRYLLQIDDDSFITGPISYNIVDTFDQKGQLMGARYVKTDIPMVLWGLAELARYFLLTEKLVPTILFDHCDPQTIQGLYTRSTTEGFDSEQAAAIKKLGAPTTGGWDGTILNGNFVVLSLDFWYRPEVQRFVQLCRASGGSVRYRWNEQGVQSMVWQLFVRPEEYHQFEFDYQHRGSVSEALLKDAGV